MKLTSEELRTLYQEQTARSHTDRADCLSEETMIDAAEGKLSRSEREKIAGHLMACSDCAEEYRFLRELKPWADQAADSASWSASVIRPVKLSPDKDDRAILPQTNWIKRFFDSVSPGLAASTIAAALLVISLACVIWAVLLRRENARITAQLNEQRVASDRGTDSLAETRRQLEETGRRAEEQQREIAELRRSIEDLSQPQVNVPITDLMIDSARGKAPGDITTVIVPAGANIFTLILNGANELSFPNYALEILDTRGQRLFRVEGLRKSEAGNFIVSLSRRLLPAGRYRLRLYGLRAGKTEPVGDYFMRVRYQ
jgi:hypothetical protein